MHKSLSEEIENLRLEGFHMIELIKDGSVRIGDANIKDHNDLSILDILNFESGSSPSEEVALYKLASSHGEKGYLLLAFGEHIDSLHSNLINDLLRKRS